VWGKITNDLYKKILIATDGSDHTEKAIAHAIELAKLTGAQLHAVYVISIISPPENLDIKTHYETELSVSIVASMEGLKKILEGQPAKEILRLAEEQSFDLIVMGTLRAESGSKDSCLEAW
jgi:nucleotide-binding universal stress UspA family protein